MNPISRLKYLWDRRDDKEMKITLMFYTCLCLIIGVDLVFGYFFFFISKVMFVVNALCLLVNLFIYHLFEQDKRSIGVSILLTELYVFIIFSTLIMGWGYGFQQYIYGILCILSYHFIFMMKKNIKQFMLPELQHYL